MLVGDILLSAREAVPDLPGVIPNPASGQVSVTAATGLNPFAAGTYYLVWTYVNAWGETSVSAEFAITLNGTQVLRVDASNCPYVNIISAINLYVGTVSGSEILRYQLTIPTGGVVDDVFIVDTTTVYSASTPPSGNSAFLPDTSGTVCSIGQYYRYFNDAMNSIAIANGGVPDVSGFPSVTGQADYTIPGDWKDIDAGWFDGYPISLGSGKQVYRHNALTAISGMMSYVQVGKQLVCEMFPQPNRTAGASTTSAALSITGNSVTTNGFTGFVLPYGYIALGVIGGVYEVVSFTASGNNITSMIRGLGGTTAQAWPSGTPFTELNVQIAGWRAPTLYTPGSALQTINIPSDWVPLIHLYVLARVRRLEQQESEASDLIKQFMAGLQSATKRKAPIGERQITTLDDTTVQVYPLLSKFFGGGIIP